MSRVTLVVTLAAVMASMMVLAVGSAVAKPDPGKDVYTQTVSGSNTLLFRHPTLTAAWGSPGFAARSQEN